MNELLIRVPEKKVITDMYNFVAASEQLNPRNETNYRILTKPRSSIYRDPMK